MRLHGFRALAAKVITPRLCTGCGTCAACCPAASLKMVITPDGNYRPVCDTSCTQCGKCESVCPEVQDCFNVLNTTVFGSSPENRLLGNYRDCFLGYAQNKDIRYEATSGGVIPVLLKHLMDTGAVDGVLMCRQNDKNPLVSSAFIARNTKDLINGMGSRYVPIPVNELLKVLMQEEGRFAVVGLPCHMRGIRLAEREMSALKGKIVIRLGLVCSHVITYSGVRCILDYVGTAPDDVVSLAYRGNGWPGGIRVSCRNGRSAEIPNQNSRWSDFFGCYFNTPFYCTVCQDHMNELADISFADAWLPECIEKDVMGTSLVVVRTGQGESILNDVSQKGLVALEKTDAALVIRAQSWPLAFKKANMRARLRLLGFVGKKTPPGIMFSDVGTKWALVEFVFAVILYFNVAISSTKLFRIIIKFVPDTLLRRYKAHFKRMLPLVLTLH